jgi:hypothetical protein
MKKLVLVLFFSVLSVSFVMGAQTKKEKWLAMNEVEKFNVCITIQNSLPMAAIFYSSDLGGNIVDAETGEKMLNKAFEFLDTTRSLSFWKILIAKMDSLYQEPKYENFSNPSVFWEALWFMSQNSLMDIK